MSSFAVLDIGSSQILALAGQVGMNSELQVIGANRQPGAGFKYGTLGDPVAAREVIEVALREIEQQSGQTFNEVYISVAAPDYQSVSQYYDCPIARTVRQADVDGLIRQALAVRLPEHHTMLHVMPSAYSLDERRYDRPPLGIHGQKLRLFVHMVCLDEGTAKNLRLVVSAGGRRVRRMFLQSLAAARAVVKPEEIDLGACVIQIGASTTNLVVYAFKMSCHSMSWPVGGGTLTEDIAHVLRTPLGEADKLKQLHGCALHAMATDAQPIHVQDAGGRPGRTISQQQLSAIIEGRMEDVFMAIREELERSGLLQRLAAGCILTGGGCQVAGLAPLAEEVLGLPARIGQPAQFSDPLLCRPDYAAVVGLLQLANQTTTPPILQMHP